MPILSKVGRRSLPQRSFAAFLYVALTIFGATMLIPFLITLTGSNSNNFDYERFAVVPRSLWSKEDRFAKGIVNFVNGYPGWFTVLQNEFPEAPANWTSWRTIGLDTGGVDRLARTYLDADAATMSRWKLQAADYCEFALGYPIEDTLATFTNEGAADYISDRYEAKWAREHPGEWGRRQGGLDLLSRFWEVPVPNFVAIRFDAERRAPMGQQSWRPPNTPKQADYNALREALLHGFGTPGVTSAWKSYLRAHGRPADEVSRYAVPDAHAPDDIRSLWLEFSKADSPASPVLPYPLRLVWLEFLDSDEVRKTLGLKPAERFDIARYNALAATDYPSLEQTPFPIPKEGFAGLQALWRSFVEARYPLRLTKLAVTPEVTAQYRQFLEQRCKTVAMANRLLGTNFADWSGFAPTETPGSNPDIWMDFAKRLPFEDRIVTSSEAAYQQFLLTRYGSLEKINAAYGWDLRLIEEAKAPFDKAYAITYLAHQNAFAWSPLWSNYHVILKFLVNQGNAIPVTLWLIVLTIFMTLTVNPIAGYALSRFNLRGKDKILLFCLATSAFPAMVSAIPGYLLMRDLGLLNTFYALVLPGAASGMGIFILKGFFDSLPQELYEAATIDGAREWQIFSFVTLPMIKPILAVNALHAFIAAYSGWEWALIICQDKSMWTLSVWLYQASQWWSQSPWITTAGFVIASIPTLLVFLFCQNIIMKGIIVPSMK